MKSVSEKKAFGWYLVPIAALLSLAGGIFFMIIHGTFGLDSTHNGMCYDPVIVWLLIGGGALALLLWAFKKPGLAAAAATLAPGAAICFFIYKCYWYVVDVFVGIDEKHGFDPRFITFVILAVAAFVIGELAVYFKKTKAAQ